MCAVMHCCGWLSCISSISKRISAFHFLQGGAAMDTCRVRRPVGFLHTGGKVLD
jgi:hypothetical protein